MCKKWLVYSVRECMCRGVASGLGLGGCYVQLVVSPGETDVRLPVCTV